MWEAGFCEAVLCIQFWSCTGKWSEGHLPHAAASLSLTLWGRQIVMAWRFNVSGFKRKGKYSFWPNQGNICKNFAPLEKNKYQNAEVSGSQWNTSAPNRTSDTSTFSHFLSFSSRIQKTVLGNRSLAKCFNIVFVRLTDMWAAACLGMQGNAPSCQFTLQPGRLPDKESSFPIPALLEKESCSLSSSAVYFWSCFNSLWLQQWSFKFPSSSSI